MLTHMYIGFLFLTSSPTLISCHLDEHSYFRTALACTSVVFRDLSFFGGFQLVWVYLFWTNVYSVSLDHYQDCMYSLYILDIDIKYLIFKYFLNSVFSFSLLITSSSPEIFRLMFLLSYLLLLLSLNLESVPKNCHQDNHRLGTYHLCFLYIILFCVS